MKYRVYDFCPHQGPDDIKHITPKEYEKVSDPNWHGYSFSWLHYTGYEFDTEEEAFMCAKALAKLKKNEWSNSFTGFTIGISDV
jgi:hypothetical protein